ncbi:MAG: hypothetical protein ACRDTJ_15510 [Pseudonocardiaceae bacterium]
MEVVIPGVDASLSWSVRLPSSSPTTQPRYSTKSGQNSHCVADGRVVALSIAPELCRLGPRGPS